MSISATSPFFNPARAFAVDQDLSQPDMYKAGQAEAYGNLLDRPASAGHGVYQPNQTDLECLRAGRHAAGEADGVVAKWEGPDLDAARAAACFNAWSEAMISSLSTSLLLARSADFFRPNPNGDGMTLHRAEQGFMDYTDDSCVGLAAERTHQRVSDGTSNTLMFGERRGSAL